jgi:hypothetical protein
MPLFICGKIDCFERAENRRVVRRSEIVRDRRGESTNVYTITRIMCWKHDGHVSVCNSPGVAGKIDLEQFQAKLKPVRHPETRQNKESARFHDSAKFESAPEVGMQ